MHARLIILSIFGIFNILNIYSNMNKLNVGKISVVAAIFSFGLVGCFTTPKHLQMDEQLQMLSEDRIKAQKNVEPVGSLLSFNEAVARGLKYNLDHRAKLLEQAIALGAYDLSKFDMLPKILTTAGYNYRNNFFITEVRGAYSGNPSLNEPFVSSARESSQYGLALNWNILDFGVSYFTARQNADRILVASERRRRTMHVLVQDIQSAYLRAAAAQKLKNDIEATIKDATDALESSRKGEVRGLKSPLEALRYQKTLLDNIKILSLIDQDLSTARIELNQLINLPAKSNFKLEDPDLLPVPHAYTNAQVEDFELRAMVANADLKESIYNARIAVQETRKSLLRLFPSLTFNTGPQRSTNSYYINKEWVESSANISFNFWNLLSAPTAINNASQNKELAAQKRMMMQMAILSQVHLSKIQLGNTNALYQQSSQIDTVDKRIAEITTQKFQQGKASKAEKVSADSSYIISKLRKYQALSQLFAASGKMQATTGLEPHFKSLDEVSLPELTARVNETFTAWNSGKLPELAPLDSPKTSNASETKNAVAAKR
jgi:outer membrane protein TolC